MKPRILVTGGSGRLGRFVLEDLASTEFELVDVDIHEPRVPLPNNVRFERCDLTDMESALRVLADADAVVHLAAIPDPFSDPPERVMAVNTALTLNVCEACKQNGIRRVVYGSSESATGFGIHEVEHRPLWLPIDESHPCWPHETYSLSKYFGEVMFAEFAHAGWVDVVALRYSWVWMPYCAEPASQLVEAMRQGRVSDRPGFGSFIAPQDVASAVRRGIEYLLQRPDDAADFDVFFATARETFLPISTLDAVRRHFNPLPEVRDTCYFTGNTRASVFDIRKAERVLGWTPRHSIDDFNTWFVRE